MIRFTLSVMLVLGKIHPGNAQHKKQLLKEYFGIEMTTDLEQEVDIMCNLSEGIEQRGIEKGRQQGIEQGIEHTALEMLRDKLDVQTIKKYTKLSVEKINSLGKMHGLL